MPPTCVTGSIPGPILFGKLIDITCNLWQVRCGEQGSCFSYDNNRMSWNILAIIFSVKLLSTLFFLVALVAYKVPKSNSENSTDSDASQNKNTLQEGQKEDSPPPPTPTALGVAFPGNRKSSQSVHTAVTMLSDSTPTTPASPNGHAHTDWSHL